MDQIQKTSTVLIETHTVEELTQLILTLRRRLREERIRDLREKLVKLDTEDGHTWLNCIEITIQNMWGSYADPEETGESDTDQVMYLKFRVAHNTGLDIDPIDYATVNVTLTVTTDPRHRSRSTEAFVFTSGFEPKRGSISFGCTGVSYEAVQNRFQDEELLKALRNLDLKKEIHPGHALAISRCIKVISRNAGALGFM